jgi:hypothetical protein
MNLGRNVLIFFSLVVIFSEIVKLQGVFSRLEEKNIHSINNSLEKFLKVSFSVTLCFTIATVVLSFFTKSSLRILNITIQCFSILLLFFEFVSSFFAQTRIIAGFPLDVLDTSEVKTSLRCCRFSSIPQTNMSSCFFEETCDERLIEIYQKSAAKYSLSTCASVMVAVGCLLTTISVYLDLFPAISKYEKVNTKTVLDVMEDL